MPSETFGSVTSGTYEVTIIFTEILPCYLPSSHILIVTEEFPDPITQDDLTAVHRTCLLFIEHVLAW